MSISAKIVYDRVAQIEVRDERWGVAHRIFSSLVGFTHSTINQAIAKQQPSIGAGRHVWRCRRLADGTAIPGNLTDQHELAPFRLAVAVSCRNSAAHDDPVIDGTTCGLASERFDSESSTPVSMLGKCLDGPGSK